MVILLSFMHAMCSHIVGVVDELSCHYISAFAVLDNIQLFPVAVVIFVRQPAMFAIPH